MKRYISYSLWGENKVYIYGVIENVLDAKKFYEGWIVRVHYNNTVPENIVEWLKSQDNVELVHHNSQKSKASNTFWRFEDLFIKDATVLVRDVDSRFSKREVKCVEEWLNSSQDFHIIRDHKHHLVPIMAGMFGCRNNCLEYIGGPNGNRNINRPPMHFEKGLAFMHRFVDSLPTERDTYNIDQIFLGQYIYPYIIGNTFVHCSHNAYEPFARELDKVESGFVGEVVTECPQASKIMNDIENTFERIAAI